MTLTDILLDKVVALGATLRPPAMERQIGKAEHALQCEFPEGIRDFYRRCDGVGHPTSERMWDFYSLDRLVESTLQKRSASVLTLDAAEELPYASLVCFCDVLIGAPTYLFCATRGDSKFGSFFADQAGQGWLVASSYEDFVRVYVAQHDNVLLMAETEKD